MREIKFRAWVERHEVIDYMSGQTWNNVIKDEMVPVTGLHFWEGQELTEISIDTKLYGEIQNILLENHSTSIKLMQYTGLKDVNGVEIYEGDIIEVLDPWTKHKHNGIIEFGEDGWIVNFIGIFTVERMSYINPIRRKVIGNVYENPELIK